MITKNQFYLFEKEYCKRVIAKLGTIDTEKTAGFFDDLEKERDNILSFNGSEANIQIKGPLFNADDLFIRLFFGGTMYADIIDAINTVKNKASIQKVNFIIDSPGGVVAGADNVASAIKNLGKITEAKIENLGASAAFLLASQADSITALSPMVEVGSIGIIQSFLDDSEHLNTRGLREITLTSVEAPHKDLDITTNEGQQLVIDRLNDLHAVFASRVAEGRGVTVEQVNSNFGKGDVLIAEKALAVGMIDRVDNQLTGAANRVAVGTGSSNQFDFAGLKTADISFSKNEAQKRVSDFLSGHENESKKVCFSVLENDENIKTLSFLDVHEGELVVVESAVEEINEILSNKKYSNLLSACDKVELIKVMSLFPVESKGDKSGEFNLKGDKNMADDKKTLSTEELKALGAAEERNRIADLTAWSTHNPETKKVVDEAVASGKSVNDVMPQLMAEVKNTSYKVAAAEGKDVNPATPTTPTGKPEGEEAEKEEEGKEEAKLSKKETEVASAIAKTFIGGSY